MLRNDRIILLGQALESDIKAGSPSGPLFAENVGMALAVELLSLASDPSGEAVRLSSAQLQRVLAYIDANLDQPLTIDILCRKAGVSSSHLRTWFKAAMDVTVHRYILRRRLEHARQLLLEGDRKLSDIALEAGFSHQSQPHQMDAPRAGTQSGGAATKQGLIGVCVQCRRSDDNRSLDRDQYDRASSGRVVPASD